SPPSYASLVPIPTVAERGGYIDLPVRNDAALPLLLDLFFALRRRCRFPRRYCRVRRCIFLLLFCHDSLHSSDCLKTLTSGKREQAPALQRITNLSCPRP